jgi:hypothetical protein
MTNDLPSQSLIEILPADNPKKLRLGKVIFEEKGIGIINQHALTPTSITMSIRYAPSGWQDNPDYVYIGRAGKGQDGYFGNPFPLVKGLPRGSTLQKYREWAENRYKTDEEFRERVQALHGKRLVCFCAPSAEGLEATLDDAVCHGQILAYMAKYGVFDESKMELF